MYSPEKRFRLPSRRPRAVCRSISLVVELTSAESIPRQLQHREASLQLVATREGVGKCNGSMGRAQHCCVWGRGGGRVSVKGGDNRGLPVVRLPQRRGCSISAIATTARVR